MLQTLCSLHTIKASNGHFKLVLIYAFCSVWLLWILSSSTYPSSFVILLKSKLLQGYEICYKSHPYKKGLNSTKHLKESMEKYSPCSHSQYTIKNIFNRIWYSPETIWKADSHLPSKLFSITYYFDAFASWIWISYPYTKNTHRNTAPILLLSVSSFLFWHFSNP